MPQVPIGIHLGGVGGTLKRTLATAARLGADAVQIDARGEQRPSDLGRTGTRQILKYLEDYRLRVCAIEFRTRRGYEVPDDLERRIDATKEALAFAYSLGAKVVVNSIGRIPDDETSDEWRLLVETLTDLGQYGQRCGAILAADTGYDPPDRLIRLVEALPPASIAINFNPGNLIVHGYATLMAAESLGQNVAQVYATDGIRDRRTSHGSEVPLGQGSADIPGVMAVLADRGYRGYWTIPTHPLAGHESSIQNAIKYLRAL